MKNVVAALNSSIQFHKKNFWIDPVSKNQYFVGVQYFEEGDRLGRDLARHPDHEREAGQGDPAAQHCHAAPRLSCRRRSLTTTCNRRSTSRWGSTAATWATSPATSPRASIASERSSPSGVWLPYDPSDHSGERALIKGATIELSGEYSRMQETFRSLGFGLILATLLIYFLMAALFKSYLTPLVILFAVPLGLIGVVTMLYLTNTAINVQSLLGVIFMVGIVVSNTVLLVDFAQHLQGRRGIDARSGDPQGGLDPRPPGRDDGARRVLRSGPDGVGPGPRKRGQRPSRPSGHRRHPRRVDHHAGSSSPRFIPWSCETPKPHRRRPTRIPTITGLRRKGRRRIGIDPWEGPAAPTHWPPRPTKPLSRAHKTLRFRTTFGILVVILIRRVGLPGRLRADRCATGALRVQATSRHVHRLGTRPRWNWGCTG